MNIHILRYASKKIIHNIEATSTRNFKLLEESAKKSGHTLITILAEDCQLCFDKKPYVLIHNKRPRNINVLITRANFPGMSENLHSPLIEQFELANIPVINKAKAVSDAKNKVKNIQILTANNIPIPKTFVIRSSQYIENVVKKIGNYPVILKTVGGSQGAGVSIVESQRGLRSIIEMMIKDETSAPLIIQEYISESSGRDLRVFFVHEKIVAAMERIAQKEDEFRSNFKLGGKVQVVELSRKEKNLAIKATKVSGLNFAGVDILRTKSGPKILEVNANPGLEGITKATGIDVAGAIIDYAVNIGEKTIHTRLKKQRQQQLKKTIKKCITKTRK